MPRRKLRYKRTDGTKAYRKTIRINGHPEQATFSRLEDANKWYSEKSREKELSKHGLNSQMKATPFGEFAELWLAARKKSGKPVSSWNVDAQRLRSYYIPCLKNQIVSQITPETWERVLNDVADNGGHSAATFNRHRSLVHKLYADAIRKYKTALINPITAIEKRHEGQGQAWDYFSTRGEIRKYLEAAKQISTENRYFRSFYFFAVVALNTGARISEILDLRNENVLIPQRRIEISSIFDSQLGESCQRTKSKKTRWVGMSDSLLNANEERLKTTNFKRPDDLLVHNIKGQHWKRWNVGKVHKMACERAEVKHIRVHDLRHTFASHWIMNEGTLADLKELLGHSSMSMTQKYAHLSPDHLVKKANTVSF